MTQKKMTHEILEQNFPLLSSDPQKYLNMVEQLISQNPLDADAYFSRHRVWEKLQRHDLALGDLNKSIELEPHYVTFRARGKLLRKIGRYEDAIRDFDTSEAIDPEAWKGSLGPLFRADCHARLGVLEQALADCAILREDHWTPGLFDLPAGTKAEVIEAVKYIAAVARHAPSRR